MTAVAVTTASSPTAGGPAPRAPAAGPPGETIRASRVVRGDPWSEHVRVGIANVALGALTGGVVRALSDGSFDRGAWQGALGGGLIFGGKEMSGRKFWGSGLSGRLLAGAGGALIVALSDDEAIGERWVAPVGPFELHVVDGAVRPRVRLPMLTVTLLYAADERRSFDLARSLSAGTPVFRLDHGDPDWLGLNSSGVITLRRQRPENPFTERRVQQHEQVHTVQFDGHALLWGYPLEGALLSLVPGGEAVHRHVTLGAAPAVMGVTPGLDYRSAYWEWEAEVGSGQR